MNDLSRSPLANIAQDIRFALRSFRKSPVFTAVALLSLAMGIGANTAIFSLISQLILRPLPVRNPNELVLMKGRGRHYGSNNGPNAISYPMYQDFRDKNQVFSGMMCRSNQSFTAGEGSQAEIVPGEVVSGNYFQMLGIKPALGRVFTASDDLHQGAHPYVVLGYAYWKSRFSGDPAIVGKPLRLNNSAFTIVGVAAPGFNGMEPGIPANVFVPITMAPTVRPGFTSMYSRRQRWVNAFGRLKPGVDARQAQAALQPLFHQIIDQEVLEPAFRNASPYAKSEFLKMWMELLPGAQGNSFVRRQYEKPLWVLMGIVAAVLLIACANLASLLAARAAARQKEIAVRLALGSSRARLVQQLLTESLMLAIGGGLAAIGLAILLTQALTSFLPSRVGGYTISAIPDAQILAFTAGISILAGMAFGLIPALQSTRPDIAPTLKDQASGGGAHVGFRKALVAAQVTLSLVLLIGAGVFVRSLDNLRNLDPGFKTAGVIQFSVNLGQVGYGQDRATDFFHRLEDRLNNAAGIKAASASNMGMLANNEWDMWVAIEGYRGKSSEVPDPHFNAVGEKYFDTMSMHIVNGRAFSSRDTNSAPKVAIVNAKLAKKYFGEANPVGKHIGVGGDPDTKMDIEIVGVANDARYESLRDDIPEQVYLPILQNRSTSNYFYVHADRDPASAFATIRNIVHDLDPNVPVANMKTFDRQLEDSLASERLTATLGAVFGVLATSLVLIGLYGVMSFVVTRRSREIGIRMALGALKGSVVWSIMREVLVLVGGGILIGLPAAYALARLVRAQLYGIDPGDPTSIALATLLLAIVTCFAGYVPARRAAAFDPLKILRYE